MKDRDKGRPILPPYCVWFTGLPASGKTTLAKALVEKLRPVEYHPPTLILHLDGDIVRHDLNYDLGFTDLDRIENIRRVAEVNKLFLNAGGIVVNSFISPSTAVRNMAAKIIGGSRFFLFYVNAPLKLCEKRDPKGMFKKARQGVIKDFTGIDGYWEAPKNHLLELNTERFPVDECVQQMLGFLF